MNYGIYHCWEKYAADLWPLLAFCFVHSLLNPEAYPTPGEGEHAVVGSLEPALMQNFRDRTTKIVFDTNFAFRPVD